MQLTRGFDLKTHHRIKRHDHPNAPDDEADAGTTTRRPRNVAGATVCHRRAVTTFMAAILERRAGQTPPTTRSAIENFPPIKIDFKEFSEEPDEWTTWSKVHRAQLSALGCAGALTETAGDGTKVNHDDFDRGSVDPDLLRKA